MYECKYWLQSVKGHRKNDNAAFSKGLFENENIQIWGDFETLIIFKVHVISTGTGYIKYKIYFGKIST